MSHSCLQIALLAHFILDVVMSLLFDCKDYAAMYPDSIQPVLIIFLHQSNFLVASLVFTEYHGET